LTVLNSEDLLVDWKRLQENYKTPL